MTTDHFIEEYLIKNNPAILEALQKQFGKKLTNLNDITVFTMNNHNQDFSNKTQKFGMGVRTTSWIQDISGMADMTQFNFLNGELMSQQLNPTLGDMDPGFSDERIWMDSFLYNHNLGIVYRYSSWCYIQYNWHTNIEEVPTLYLPVDLFEEGTDVTIPVNNQSLTKNVLTETKLLFDMDNDGNVTVMDLGALLPILGI